MRLDGLIEGLQEVRTLIGDDTPVYVESETIVNGKALNDAKQLVTRIKCFTMVKGGDFIVIKGSNE